MKKIYFLSNAQSRILLWIIVLVFLAIIGSSLATRQILLLQLRDNIDSSLEQEVEEVKRLIDGRNPETGEPFGDDVSAIFDVFLSRSIPEDDEFFITIVNQKIHASSPIALPYSLQINGNVIDNWAQLDFTKKGKISTIEETLIYMAHPIQTEGNGQGVFIVAHSLTNRQKEIDQVIFVVFMVMVCFFVSALTLAWITTGQVLSPLQLLTQTARSIKSADQQLGRRIPVRGTDEIAELTETFNAMLDRLQASFTSQQNFINDASHELQTPITVIQGHLDLLSQRPNDSEEIMWLMKDELQRMSRLVKDLLLLARAERPDFLCLEMLQVNELTQSIFAKSVVIAFRQWFLVQMASVKIVADRDRITQAMMNLVKNAIENTQETDRIEIGSRLIDKQVYFWVRNTGSVISLENQQRIFQRFARIPGSRPHSEGAGLGLAIVQAIAEAHGGYVDLKSSPEEGSIFTLILPLEPPQDRATV
ncbi:HAMP domain-containing protein [Synechococcales cyanobacterium C]|uniref:histidine kinase n=1 Tax=Petrachloros mirabilis ULC683 TaxID=2781853 RepID=A0A8K2A7M8_9CYAN|nr:HAMP domain-containing sensor histidine kinase [Petrachloros mirabilis]NCJ06250.1 HAMP domain-containing protein [Petrachloros mirabilis ULC683]